MKTACWIAIVVACFQFGCTVRSENATVEAWQKHRDKGLRSADGWLTLAGLFWLEPGRDQTIGSGDGNDFVLPKGSAPEHMGTLRLANGAVTFTNTADTAVTMDNQPVHAPVTLSYDEEKPSVVHAGSVSFLVIKRNDRFGIRAKDSNSPVLKNFTGMTYFPVSDSLHFRDAKFIPDARKVPILNVLGQTEMQDSPGLVEFSYAGNTYHLRPVFEGKTLFFLFKDPTNRIDTYQAGRMLNTPLPKNGKVDLDFNRSYNPPCTFTPYATCPLPPRENTLTFSVTAGEKRYRHGNPEAQS